jgi:homoserine kinase type II
MNLRKKILTKILSKYNIGKYKDSEHIWWAFGNTIFILKTNKGKYILKLFHKKNQKHIKFQLNLINKLNKQGIPVPKIIKTKNKKLSYKLNGFFISIQEFIQGKHTYTFNKKLVKNCAKVLLRLDKQLKNMKVKSRFGYKPNHQFTFKQFKVKRIGNFNLTKEAEQVNICLKKIRKNKLKKGFIHGDFHGVNLLSKNNKITAVLDFDDAHYDYLIEELAVFLAHSFVHKDKINKNFIKLFMKEYQKDIILNKEEKKALYFFIKQRFLASLNWTEKHKRKLKNKKKIKETNKNLINSIKSYKNFKKIGLNEFYRLL